MMAKKKAISAIVYASAAAAAAVAFLGTSMIAYSLGLPITELLKCLIPWGTTGLDALKR